MVAIHHVSDRGIFGKRHQRGPGAARRGVGPCSLDLRLVQLEASLNRQEQGLSFNTTVD